MQTFDIYIDAALARKQLHNGLFRSQNAHFVAGELGRRRQALVSRVMCGDALDCYVSIWPLRESEGPQTGEKKGKT